MFDFCESIETIIYNSKFSSVENMANMFAACSSLKEIIYFQKVSNSSDIVKFWTDDCFLNELDSKPTLYVKDAQAEALFEANEDYMNMFGADRIKVYDPNAIEELEEPDPESGDEIQGDMNGDKEITIEDIRILLQKFINKG